MERQTETFYVQAVDFSTALTRAAQESKSAAVVKLVMFRDPRQDNPNSFRVELTKVVSTSGARSVTSVERWQTERRLLLDKADALIARLAKIEKRAETLAERLRNAGAEPE